MHFSKPLLNKSGFSLVEVMAALAIMTIGSLAVVEIINQSNKSTVGLQQKLETLEFKQTMMTSFNETNCLWQLNAKIPNVDVSVTGKTSKSYNLDALYSGLTTTTPLLAAAGENLIGTQTGLKIDKITIGDFEPTANPNQFNVTFTISYDQSTLKRSIQPLTFQRTLTTKPTDPLTAKTVTACTMPGATSNTGVGPLKNIQIFKGQITTGTYTPSAGVTSILVYVIGTGRVTGNFYYSTSSQICNGGVTGKYRGMTAVATIQNPGSMDYSISGYTSFGNIEAHQENSPTPAKNATFSTSESISGTRFGDYPEVTGCAVPTTNTGGIVVYEY